MSKQKSLNGEDVSEKELEQRKKYHKVATSKTKAHKYISNEEKLSGNKGRARRFWPGLKNV